MKRLVVMLLLCGLVLAPLHCTGPIKQVIKPRAAVTVTHFADMYNGLLANITTNFRWQDGQVGNWIGDWTYDAGAFAPEVLFRSGHTELAKQTMDYVMSLETFVTKIAEFAVGFGAYYNGPEFYPEKGGWCGLMGAGIAMGAGMVIQDPNPVGNLNGYIAAMAAVANTCFMDANVCLTPLYATSGNNVFSAMNTLYWDEGNGYYIDMIPAHQGAGFFSTFQNGSALWAVAWHYGIYNDPASLAKLEAIYNNLETRRWFTQYNMYVDFDITVPPSFDLGANMLIARGYEWAYWVTGDIKYLNKVGQILTGIQSHLLFNDCDYPGFKMLAHHGPVPEGSACWGNYCTGCNFLALNVIWHYNDLKQNGPLGGRIPINPPSGPGCSTVM